MEKLLRQLQDIQQYADRLVRTEPDESEIQNYSDYQVTLIDYLRTTLDDEEIMRLVDEIPRVEVPRLKAKDVILHMILPQFMTTWFTRMASVRTAMEQIDISRAKFASIEFLVRFRY